MEVPEHVRRHWFPSALSDRIRSVPQRVMLFDSPVVLVRDRGGVVLALEDRCPHRGVPLSAGGVDSNGLVCRYHGWAFGADGRCTAMPGSAADSRPLVDVRVPSFKVVERDGLVWLTHAATDALPQRVMAMNPAHNRFLWQTVWGAPIVDAQENFLDALHTHTVHPGLVRRADARRPVKVSLQVGGDGFCVDYSGQAQQSGTLFKLFESRRTRECAYYSGLSVAQLEYRYASGWAMWITLYFTPATQRSTHVFATLHVEGRWAPAWLVNSLVWPFLRKVASQDRRMLELQELGRECFPNRRPVVTGLDVVRPYLEEAWSGKGTTLPSDKEMTLYL